MRKNCRSFEEWAMSQFWELNTVVSKTTHLHIHNQMHGDTVVALIFNDKKEKVAIARVKESKYVFSAQIAFGLAWAKYKGERIPDFSITLENLYAEDKVQFKMYGAVCEIVQTNPYFPNCYICVNTKTGEVYNFLKTQYVKPIK